MRRFWPALYKIYQEHRQQSIIREQRQRIIRFLLDDNERAIGVLQHNTKDTLK